MSSLERHLGVKLLERSSRQVTPTAAGRRCFDRCVEILELVRNIDNLGIIEKVSANPGSLSVAATPDVFEFFLEEPLADFVKSTPGTGIQRRLFSDDDSQEREWADLIITWKTRPRAGELVRTLATTPQGLYASPDLIQRRGAPDSPRDLAHMPTIIDSPSEYPELRFALKNGSRRIRLRKPVVAGSPLQSRERAIAGTGISVLPRYLGDPFVRYGRLVRVLPGQKLPGRTLVSITPAHSIDLPRVSILRVALEEWFLAAIRTKH